MSDHFSRYIQERLSALGISQSELCRRAGVSRQTLHSLLADAAKLPALNTVTAVAGALQVHPLRLLQVLFDERVPVAGTVRSRQRRGDKSAFVRDVSFPDGALVLPGQCFVKTWELQNVGSVPWVGRVLRCVDEEITVYARTGEQLHLALPLKPDAEQLPIPDTLPGEKVQLSMAFTAPDSPATVLSYWKSAFADGRLCYPNARGVWVKVLVSTLATAAFED